jgi:hypothetical protein
MNIRSTEWSDDPMATRRRDPDMTWLGALIIFAAGMLCVISVSLWGVAETVGVYFALGSLYVMLDGLSGHRVWASAIKIALAIPALIIGLRLMGVGG